MEDKLMSLCIGMKLRLLLRFGGKESRFPVYGVMPFRIAFAHSAVRRFPVYGGDAMHRDDEINRALNASPCTGVMPKLK